MQDYQLTVDKFLDHAARWSGGAHVAEGDSGRLRSRRDYASLRDRSNRLSGALRYLGAAAGDRIGTLAWNTLPHLEAYYASMGSGMVCHTLNPRMTAEHLAVIVTEAADRIIMASSDLLPLLMEVAQRATVIEHVVLLDGPVPPQVSQLAPRFWQYEELLAEHGSPTAWGEFSESTPAGLCYTSGTTGRPKGVLYSHRGNYLHTLRALQADAMGFTPKDTILVAVPMFHANGWGIPFAGPAVGANLVLPGRHTDGASLARLMREAGVTVAVGIHTLWIAVADALRASGETLPDLGRVIIGGSSCPETLIARIEDQLGVQVQTSWGMTELAPLGAISPIGVAGRPALSSGRPPMGLDLKLVDADGIPLVNQVGVVGRLRVKGASVIDRYFAESESALDEGGYFDTGDLAMIDAAGNLTICGRSKELIKSGGEWINPAEIEAVVGSEPAVSLVAVIGMPDEKWTERPLLIVQPHAGQELDMARLIGKLRDKVAKWWIPERIAKLAEIPLTGSGKIDKVKLRTDLAAGKISTEPLSP